MGRRIRVADWDTIAPLVAWPFEPAWDRVVLVGSYQVGAPRGIEQGRVAVDVGYSVLGQVSALGFDTSVHVETVPFVVEAMEGQWRIVGAPPPPHLFWSYADVERLTRSLEAGDVNFLPNTLFVWWMLRSAGWNVPLVSTADLLSGDHYRVVREARPGDVVVYLRAGLPYHVGLLEADDQVVSSTLNAGIVRGVIGAFAGEVEYLRLVQPEAEDKAIPDPTPAAAATPGAAPGIAAPGGPRPTPTAGREQRKATPSVRANNTRPQARKRGKADQRRTPSATGDTARRTPTPRVPR